ncbi:MAG: 4-alpha-glucanotransferase [Treponema sp.]|nr:4-alpha-glucanotransferase [Treponema sp.]
MAKTTELDTNSRLIGTVIPVGALRTEKSLGVGEFLDLLEFGSLCTKMGVKLIQILPVNDTGHDSSPYSALTAFGLNPMYLSIGEMEEASGFEKALAAIKKDFDQQIRYPYEALLKAKLDLLRRIFEKHQSAIHSSAKLASWIEENPWVIPYAVFRRLKESNEERSWKEWRGQEGPELTEELWDDPALKDQHLFWVWVQEALDRQFHMASQGLKEMGIILEGDLPILMNEDSCDVWAHRENFDLSFSAGAPPDMYSPDGQNWGFPIYNWQAQSKNDYQWWKSRLKTAEKYYQAYRIDHVLGFFRIWATRQEDASAAMGRYIPSLPINPKDFEDLEFDKGRIRWICEPHILTGDVWDALKKDWGGPYTDEELAQAAQRVFDLALERIDHEELWLFKKSIRGDKDIAALDIHSGAKNFLQKEWINRIFFEFEKDCFYPLWFYHESKAYASLSAEEKEALDELVEKRQEASEKIWEAEGLRLLSVLTASSAMLPCAEDLGAVPLCVPRVLTKLNILGLRVVRWHREYDKKGEPYVPFEDYPELSVCTAAVHDSSCLREWWDREADQNDISNLMGMPSLPRIYNPGIARMILHKIVSAASRFRVFQIQDLMHLSPAWYAEDPASERINVPGTINDFNWTYRLPALISDIAKDEELIRQVKELGMVKVAERKGGK